MDITNDGKNDRSFQFSKRIFEAGDTVNVSLKPYGGFVAVIRKQE